MVASKAHILLVNPRYLDERISMEDAHVMPIGLYYIGAFLLDKGYAVNLLNLADKTEDPVFVFKQELRRKNYDIIGFSLTNANRWNAVECAGYAKNILPLAAVVFGGPAATFMDDYFFKICPELDFIVKGEGEHTFFELVQAIENQSKNAFDTIKGLVFKKNGTLVKNKKRPLTPDLDHLVPPSRYFTYQHLAMSRGCPGSCTFCGSPRFWGSREVRFHSPQWFANELEALSKKGVSHFYISDDTFTMDHEKVLELCRLIRKKKLAVTWNAISRVDYIDKPLLAAMRKAGCIQISFGVESGSEKIRKTLGKPMPDKAIVDAFDLTRSFGILPRAYFIYGSPGETYETIEESIDLLHYLKPLSAVFYMMVLFPGTGLYYNAVKKQPDIEKIWFEKIEDLPWFKVDKILDFEMVKSFGDRLRNEFYTHLNQFAQNIKLVDEKDLYPFHADFLSRLALTFSHGEYAQDKRIQNPEKTAQVLFEKALDYAPDSRAFLGLAMIHQKNRQFDAAESCLEKGLGHHPENDDLRLCLGINHMNQGRFNTALKMFEQINPDPRVKHYAAICRQHLTG